jgi:hypothetical protein
MAEVPSEPKLHVFVAPPQPMTRYVDPFLLEMGFSRRQATRRHHPREQFRCHVCGARRWAKNLVVRVYYDMVMIACRGECRGRGHRR